MYILFFVVNIGLAIWASIGHSFWIYFLNSVLIVIASSAFTTSTVQAIASRRFWLSGHGIGLALALIAFRSALFILPIWLFLQITESVFTAWSDGLLPNIFLHRRNNYIEIKVPTTAKRSVDEILGLFREWIDDDVAMEEIEYRQYQTDKGEVCVVFQPQSRWIIRQASEWIRNKGTVSNPPVWIEIMQDIFGHDFSVCFVSEKTFQAANFLATAKFGNKERKKFVPGNPYRRITDYRPIKTGGLERIKKRIIP